MKIQDLLEKKIRCKVKANKEIDGKIWPPNKIIRALKICDLLLLSTLVRTDMLNNYSPAMALKPFGAEV